MKPNRLINQKSPYLRQHAYNPVDWYPWCDEAFERAYKEDKPIFLSIGYSTCHWCHVMEKESFESEEIAEILNNFFISIKVDREERPDIDNIYMKACYVFQNRGGWPLSVFMMPNKIPFFVDTYIPREDMYGKIGFKSLLLRISEIWQHSREKINEACENVSEILKTLGQKAIFYSEITENTIHKAYEELKGIFDSQNGGFGKSPKFPLPLNIIFLNRYYHRYKENNALQMALKTLRKIRQGGIYDHIGGGFHRYSTDQFWIVPHFEKMLYDNVLLMIAYTEAYQITGDSFYKTVVNEIVNYLLRDMYSPEGAFYSAEDADSEGKEGEFYTWRIEEIKEALTEEEFSFAQEIFAISEFGNFRDEATGKVTGKNIIYWKREIEELTKELELSQELLMTKINSIINKLLKIRNMKVRPLRDEKILTDWNSIAAVAFAKAGVVFDKDEYINVAEKCINFIINRMIDPSGRLLHSYIDGQVSVYGFLEDHAYLAWALIELYFATFKSYYLIKAFEIVDNTVNHFWDRENFGFYQTPDYSETVISRSKDIYDGAMPSGNSVIAYVLFILSRLSGKEDYERRLREVFKFFGGEISKMPSSYVFSLISLDMLINGTTELIVIPGKSREKDILFLREIRKAFNPNLLCLIKERETEKYSPKIEKMEKIADKSTYFVCKNFSCLSPVTDREKVKALI